MEKDEKYWKEEIEKCKSPVYFFNNYCLVDGKKPEPITQEQYDKTIELIKNHYRGPIAIRGFRGSAHAKFPIDWKVEKPNIL